MKMSRSLKGPNNYNPYADTNFENSVTPGTPLNKEKYVTSAPCRAIVYAVLAHFFFMYAWMNPDEGSCFASQSFKIGKPEVPLSVAATATTEAIYATGYIDVSARFTFWFVFGFFLCLALFVHFLAFSFIEVEKDNE